MGLPNNPSRRGLRSYIRRSIPQVGGQPPGR